MVDLFDQQLLPIERLPEIALHALPFNRHPEDVGDALQKYDIALGEFTFRPAVNFEHPVRSTISLENDVHGAPDTVLDQQFRGPESLLNI